MILTQLGIFGWKEADENLVLASLLTGDPAVAHRQSRVRQDACGEQGGAGPGPQVPGLRRLEGHVRGYPGLPKYR